MMDKIFSVRTSYIFFRCSQIYVFLEKNTYAPEDDLKHAVWSVYWYILVLVRCVLDELIHKPNTSAVALTLEREKFGVGVRGRMSEWESEREEESFSEAFRCNSNWLTQYSENFPCCER